MAEEGRWVVSRDTMKDWLVLDIETRGGRPEDARKWVRDSWWPDVRLTPENIGKKFKEVHVEWEQKLALLDTAGIATVQVRTPAGAWVLHCLRHDGSKQVEGGWQIGFPDEVSMLLGLRDLLATMTDERTTLVGWNIDGFDLRRLRFAYLRAKPGLNYPKALRVSADVYDMMEEYARNFSVSRQPFVKLEVALEAFGIENHKKDMDGSQVERFINEGRFDEVLAYAWKDLQQETELFLTMTGQSARLK